MRRLLSTAYYRQKDGKYLFYNERDYLCGDVFYTFCKDKCVIVTSRAHSRIPSKEGDVFLGVENEFEPFNNTRYIWDKKKESVVVYNFWYRLKKLAGF